MESVIPTVSETVLPPRTATASLQFGNQTKTVFYDVSAFDSSDVFSVGMSLDVSNMASGRYGWTMTITYDYGDGVTQTQTFSGAESVVDRSESPYGNGVNLAGLSSLNLTNLNAAVNRGINWERSCGGQVWFSYDGLIFTPEAGESANSTLSLNSDGTFTIVDQGETFEFNAAGRLLTRTDGLTGKTVRWSWRADGTVASKTDEANRTTTFQYANGLLASATDSAGRTTGYFYDSSGRLIRVVEPDPDGDGPLSSPVISYSYDGDSSRIATVADASGSATAYEYSNGLIVSKTVDGIVQTARDPFILSAVADLSTAGYDAERPAILSKAAETTGKTTDLAGNLTEFRYDSFGNVVWKKTAAGAEFFYLYDENGRLRKETASAVVGGISQGYRTEYDYDVNGNLIKIKYNDGTTEEWTYDADFNQKLSHNDQLGNLTLFTLDGATGLTLSERRVVGLADSSENGETDDAVTTYAYYPDRSLASVTDPLGVVTFYTYDSHGNILTETTENQTTSYAYDSADRLTSATNALNQTTRYTYDNLDRLTETVYASGETSRNVYDDAGRLVSIISPGSSVFYAYDSLGRVASETDSLNRVKTHVYSNSGNLISTAISDGNSRTGENNPSAVISQTAYDAWGRVATQTDAAGVTLVYEYDPFGRVTKSRARTTT